MPEPTYRIAQRLHERRAAMGLFSYGEHLKPFNKRCSLIDAIEESADMLVYLVNIAHESRHLLMELMINSVRLREAGHKDAADGLDKMIVGMGDKEALAQYDEILGGGTVAENATVDPLSDPAISTLHKFATTELPQIETITTSGSLPTDPRDEALRVATEALNEVVCWIPDGTRKSPLERGAKVETVHDLMQMITAAIRAAGGAR